MKTGIYVHVPFCLRRCTYCDFNTYTGLLSLEGAYATALAQEIELRSERAAEIQAETLYFGGGTPSLLAVESIAAVIEAVRRHLGLPWHAEVTVEANPGTIDGPYLADLHEAGVTRLSLGAQSSNRAELEILGRDHTWEDTTEGVSDARRAGFAEVSLDLIYGLPGQSLDAWEETLGRALELAPDHLSLHVLRLGQGTPIAEAVAMDQLPRPYPSLAADMYDLAAERFHSAGFWQYEISNWARGDSVCPNIWALPPDGQTEAIGSCVSRHNLIYWRNQSWIGIGAGAHSWFRGRRWSNYPHPRVYINGIRSGRLRAFATEVKPHADVCSETMVMGLRLAEGVTARRFLTTTGTDLSDVFSAQLERYVHVGVATWDGERARLTKRGRLLGDQVLEEFLLDEGDRWARV